MLKEIAKRTKIDRMGRTFHRKVAVCSCDSCGKTYEKSYYVTMDLEALTFCSRKCLWRSKKSGLLAEKARRTLLEKYGVENPSQSPEVQERIRKNNLEKYGVEHHTKLESFKEKEKRRRTKKFGVEHHWMLDEVKQKRKETWRQNYGTDNPGAAEEIKDKIKQTFQQNYGTDNPFAAEEIKQKIEKTNIERYGYRRASQCESIHRKQVESFVGMDYDYYYSEYLPAFETYRRKVWAVTKKQPLETLENFDKRGRGNNGYHVDHIVSISDGFKNDIDPSIIGNIKNLRMLLGRENISKGPKSDMEINELLEITGAQDEMDD